MDQFLALLWLRWRLTCNLWRRNGVVSFAITLLVMLLGLGMAVGGLVAGFAGGLLGLAHASPLTIQLVWDGLVLVFLFFWVVGLVTQLQRSEMIDLRHLMHLPITLWDAFLLNYLSSLASSGVILFLPAMLGLAVGHALGAGVKQLLLIPLVITFFFMVTAWTYCLQGWLAALMTNPRRRRVVIMTVTTVFVLLVQLPNLANMISQGHRPATAVHEQHKREPLPVKFSHLDQAHPYVPVLWLPQGARALAEGNTGVAVCEILGMFALGFLGLVRAYCTTLRYYRGQETGRKTPMPAAVANRPPGRQLLVERKLPLIPDEVSAMAFANLRSMLRAPEVKMTLITNTIIFLFIGAGAILREHSTLPVAARPFVACAVAGVTFLGMIQLMANQFGYDRHGFRALVLLPTSRRYILLGKNLSLAPLALTVFTLSLALVAVIGHLGFAHLLLATCGFCTSFFLFCTVGNLASILVPYRVPAGSMQASKLKGMTALLASLSHLLLLAAGATLLFLPPLLGWLCDRFNLASGALVSLSTAALLVGLSALIYWTTLEMVGQLLQCRERRILEVVTAAIE